jgi:hypothetical protein
MWRWIPLLLALFHLLTSVVVAESDALYRINAGGGAYTDSDGNIWEADTLNGYFDTGNAHSTGNEIAGTNDQALYQTERWASAMTWTFPISTPGDYQVVLHFAEIYVSGPNRRVFDVKIQNELVLDNFDIYALVGGDAAYSESFPVTVTTSSLTIEFEQWKQKPKICAIEIIPAAPAYSLFINSGGPEYQDGDGNTWLADTSFVGGNTFAAIGTEIADTEDDIIYQSERYGALSYEIEGVPNGSVEVSLHFAEIYFTGAQSTGSREFGVKIQGELVLDAFDIFETVGANFADVETFPAEVTDGTLTIQLIKDVENPKINGISIRASGQGVSPTLPTPTTTSTAAPPTATPSTGTALYRVNAGGGQYSDSEGNLWAADAFFTSGSAFALPGVSIGLTVDDVLFSSERYDPPSGDPMKYEFPVENGFYEVRLGFAEVYGLVTGQRVFNVLVEGQTVLENHDIYAVADANTANVEIITTEVNDGVLTIDFEHVTENPKICNIAVFTASPASPTPPFVAPTPAPMLVPSPPPPTPAGQSTALHRVNVGGGAFTDSEGRDWEADAFFTGGLTYSNTEASIEASGSGTSDEFLYQSERYRSDMTYSFPGECHCCL